LANRSLHRAGLSSPRIGQTAILPDGLRRSRPQTVEFARQNGYGAFSVSESNVPEVKKYIERQAEHHRRMAFQDELRQLLARHGIAADERYLWS
jgi:putative transposase